MNDGIKFTKIYDRIVAAIQMGARIIFARGGTSSSKTWSILSILFIRALYSHRYINVIGLTYKHLSMGVLRDSKILARLFGIEWSVWYRSTEHILFFPGGGQINFVSIDKIDTAHGVRSDDLFINECNYQSWEIVDQLIARTSGLVFLDCNPSAKFWIIPKILENPAFKGSVYEDVSTYKDNPFLSKNTIQSIEAHDRNSNWWRVYGLGEWGAHEGLVFQNVQIGETPEDIIHSVPEKFGIDWGFAADAFALSGSYVVKKDGKNLLYIDDELYMHHALNKQTAPLVKEIVGKRKVVCDNARPEAIAEYVNEYGINAVACQKGKGSVEGGYTTLQEFDIIYISPECKNLYREFTTLEHEKDKRSGEFTAEIRKNQDDHGVDSVRYALEDITLHKKDIRKMFINMPSANIREQIDEDNISLQPDLSPDSFLL